MGQGCLCFVNTFYYLPIITPSPAKQNKRKKRKEKNIDRVRYSTQVQHSGVTPGLTPAQRGESWSPLMSMQMWRKRKEQRREMRRRGEAGRKTEPAYQESNQKL